MDSHRQRPDDPPETAVPAVRLARRQLLRGGLAGAPALLAVVSRPATAIGTSCTTASAYSSLKSGVDNSLQTCSGCQPTWWVNNQKSWPTGLTTSTLFKDKIGASSFYGTKTFLQCLKLGTSGNDGLVRLLVAAHLNAASVKTPATILSTGMISIIWSDYSSNGYFSPTAGIQWGADQSIVPPGAVGTTGLKAWLTTTMPNP